MNIWDEAWFTEIKHPSRYLGNEINLTRKDPAHVEVSIALAFPDVYEVGMSHLGLKILYEILNAYDWIAAERAFCPWGDMEEALRKRNLSLRAMESDRPLRAFDIVGFSLQHELTYTNVLTMLELSRIPFLSEERDRSFPLIIAGGPACFNPEPVAPLFDAIVVGDGEEVTVEICRIIRTAKRQKGTGKQDLLSQLAEVRGVYVPTLFDVSHHSDGRIKTIEPLLPGYREVRKSVVSDITQVPSPTSPLVPFMELVHDRLVIEICRGCTRGCRFCQAGMIYRPVRERSPGSVIENAEKALRVTGYEDLSLLSLSSGDYGCMGPLLRELMDRFSGQRVAISLPSLRVDSLDPRWFEEIKRVRKTGFTLAAEAGNDRLRRVINKALTNQQILDMAREVYGAGWNLIKLYFMIGLPGEEENDLHDIVALARGMASQSKHKGRKSGLNVSVSTFVPKSHTPFMWTSQVSLEESRRRISLIRNGLADKRIQVKWNQPEMSWLEGIFSRGDRRLCRALIEAWQMGARFDAWSEHFKMDIWMECFRRTGLDPDFYLYRERSLEEILPWDHIQSGVKKEYLKRELERSVEGKETPDCRERCLECGVCDHQRVAPVLCREWRPYPVRQEPLSESVTSGIRKYRLSFSKTGSARFLSHLELVRLFFRAFRRAGLNLVYSTGYHPMPKMSFASALPVGMNSMDECLDIQLFETSPIPAAQEKMNGQLPPGITITAMKDVTHELKRPKLRESHFHITLDGVEPKQGDVDKFLESDFFPVSRIDRVGEKLINARALVQSMIVIPPHDVRLVLRHSSGPELRPIDIIREVFRLEKSHAQGIKVLKTKQVLY